MTPGMEWHSGTVGTVKGRADVAGLFAGVVASLPDARAVIEDIFGQGDQVVVRVIVSGTQDRHPLRHGYLQGALDPLIYLRRPHTDRAR